MTSVCENHANEFCAGVSTSRYIPSGQPKRTKIIDFSTAGVHSFQKLVHLVVAHLLPEVCEDLLGS